MRTKESERLPPRRRPQVLVCDGDTQSQRAIKVVLRDAGCDVDVCANTEQALDRAALRSPSAAITELLLPDGDGVALIHRLREWSDAPIIVVSAVSDEHNVVQALEAGADEYITKPFAPIELVARLRALLRRVDGGRNEPCLHFSDLEIDLSARAVRRQGSEIHLTPTEYRLLNVLARNHGKLVTHGALLQQVWGPAYARETPLLRAHIANLRHKLGCSDTQRMIRTDTGIGYRLIA